MLLSSSRTERCSRNSVPPQEHARLRYRGVRAMKLNEMTHRVEQGRGAQGSYRVMITRGVNVRSTVACTN
jgi:hypothetical protein